MFNIYDKGKELFKIIADGAKTAPTLKTIIEIELAEFLQSRKRERMLQGNAYYVGMHDIRGKTRKGYFPDGEKKPNSIIIDNQYKKMVDQKVNFLVGQPIAINTDNDTYSNELNSVFGDTVQKNRVRIAKNMLNNGIAWLYLYINATGDLCGKVFPTEQILPFWLDDEHTELDFVVRVYEMEVYNGKRKDIEKFVEVYSKSGIDYFVYSGGRLIEDVEKQHQAYFTTTDETGAEQGYNWDTIPLIPFKYSSEELPLIINCKSIQDAINELYSTMQDTMIESSRSTILILKNYDGQDLKEFRQKLNENGVIKVRTLSGVDGGVDSISIEFKPENHKMVLEILKKSMIENCMGYDAKDDKIGSNANQMNIQSMYNDINLDAHNMEAEFQTSLEKVLNIINAYLYNTGRGDYTGEKVKFVFNRDMMMNESEIMTMLANLGLQLSQRTLINQVPFIDDWKQEQEQIQEEKQQNINDYAGLFKASEG